MSTFAPGTPCWVDVASPDVEAARRFYTELFGWTVTVADEPEAGGYTTFAKDGRAVAAVGPLQSDEQPPTWTTYFATEDADAVTRRVEAAGGKVLSAPFDVMEYGRMAVFMDNGGAVFAVWQAGAMLGAEITGEPGALSWVELMARDPDGAKEFYHNTLGLMPRDLAYESVIYTLWQVGDAPVAGMMPMSGPEWPPDLPPHWMVYFEVDDCDATAAKAADLGGAVSVPPTDTAAGRFAVLGDQHGAFFSIIKSNPDFQP